MAKTRRPTHTPQQPPQRAQIAHPAQAQTAQPVDAFSVVADAVGMQLADLSELRGHPVVAYVLADQAQMADEQMMHLYLHLREIGKREHLDLFLVSRGGATEVPWKIVSLFREFSERFSILIPYRAHSSATLTALGADEIVMTEMSELGPVDPSRQHPLLPKDDLANGGKAPLFISVQDLRHVLEFLKREMGEDLTPEAAATVYTALFSHVHPLAIGALEQSWALSIQVAQRCLSTHMDAEKDKDAIELIVDRLSDHYKSHQYQINRREAAELGLKVADATAGEAEALWTLHQAFAGIQIAGEAELNGNQKTRVLGIGYVVSDAGVTLGLGHVKANKPEDGLIAATWESRIAPEEPAQADSEDAPEESAPQEEL